MTLFFRKRNLYLYGNVYKTGDSGLFLCMFIHIYASGLYFLFMVYVMKISGFPTECLFKRKKAFIPLLYL